MFLFCDLPEINWFTKTNFLGRLKSGIFIKFHKLLRTDSWQEMFVTGDEAFTNLQKNFICTIKQKLVCSISEKFMIHFKNRDVNS